MDARRFLSLSAMVRIIAEPPPDSPPCALFLD
jgi:hypothetical protein